MEWIMRMNGKKDGVLMACYACLLVIGGLLTWLKYDYNAVKLEDVREACGYVSASATPVEAPKIALTFDDGPSAVWTPALLDGLKERGVKATFFLIGENADKNPEIVKRMAEEGHLIGNHTYHHLDMSSISSMDAFKKETQDVENLFEQITGTPITKFYRPPQGKYNIENLKMAQELGYHTFFWSLAYVDWYQDKQPTKDEAFGKLLKRIHPGAIVLLHSTSSTNAQILDELLTKWEEMGYTIKPLTELAGAAT